MPHYDAPLGEPASDPVQDLIDTVNADLDALEARVAALEAAGGGGGGGGSGLDGVYDVTAYGALGDGSTNDRVAVQAAIDAAGAAGGGIVYFPPGTYLIQRNASNIWCLRVNALSNITFLGLGEDCVIKTGTLSTSDLHLIFITNNSSFISFYDLVFDGGYLPDTAIAGTTEQAHLLRIGGGNTTYLGATNVSVSRCTFRYARGDGLNGIGHNDGVGDRDPVSNVRITDCTFYYCHRSGLGIQRMCQQWQVHNCYFVGTGDTELDMEPTGNGETIGFSITGNVFDHSRRSGLIAVTLTGVSSSVERHKWTVFSDNIVLNGTVQALNVDGLVIANNQFILSDGSEDETAMLYLFRRVDNVTVSGNHFVRGYHPEGVSPDWCAEDPYSVCLRFEHNTSVAPNNILVTGNLMEQYAPTGIAIASSCNNVSWVGNSLIRRSSETGGDTAIQNTTSAATSSGALVNGNKITGNGSYATLSLKTRASQTVTFSGQPANNETLTVNGQTYTFKTALTPTANEVLIGSSLVQTLVNIAEAITLGGGTGVKYAASTVANAGCYGTRMQDNVTLKLWARTRGTGGNSIACSEAITNATIGGATLAGGAQTSTNIDSIFRAREPGTAGNSITIATVADGSGTGSWTVSGTDLTFHYQSGVTTLRNMLENMRTDADTVALIDVEDKTYTLGTPTNVLTAPGDTFTAQAFSGGGGSMQYGVSFGGTNTFTDTTCTDNQILGVTSAGIRLAGTIANPLHASGNTGNTAISGLANVGSVVMAGSQYQGLSLVSSTPEGSLTAEKGSLAVVNTAGMDTTLYIKETGSGNTGWVAVQPAPAYGGFYFSTPAATTLAAATAAKASGTTTALSLAKFTMPANNRLTYTGTATRLFHVKASITVIKAASTAAALASVHLAKNGSVITGAKNRQTLANNTTDEYEFNLSWIVSLATNDYLEIFVEEAGGDDLTVQLGQLVASTA